MLGRHDPQTQTLDYICPSRSDFKDQIDPAGQTEARYMLCGFVVAGNGQVCKQLIRR